MDTKIEFKEYTKSGQDKRSAWQHFLRSSDGMLAQCKICKKILKTSGTTSTLHNHLKLIHSIDVKQRVEVQDTESCASTSTSTATGLTLTELPQKKRKLTDYFKSEDSMEVALSKLAALDGLAFSVFCTSITLRKLFAKSGYKLPASPHTIKKIIITHSAQLKTELKTELNMLKTKACMFTVSLDEWTSAQNVRYININIHSQTLKNKCFRNLGLEKIKNKGTAENCHNILREKLLQYGLTLDEDVIALVTDGASVMCALGRRTLNFHQLCHAHGIQCAVLDVLYKKTIAPASSISEVRDTDDSTTDESDAEDMAVEDEEGFIVSQIPTRTRSSDLRLRESYKNIINKVRKVTKIFKKSPTKAELLYGTDEGERKGLRLILDCRTRWSSLANMITRFLALKETVMKALIDIKCNITFHEDEIEMLQDISDSLNIIKTTVEAICQEDANLLTAEIALKFMVEKLVGNDSQISRDLLEALKERISQRRQPVLNGTLKYLHNSVNYYKESSCYPFANPSNQDIKDCIFKINSLHMYSQMTLQPGPSADNPPLVPLQAIAELVPVPTSLKDQLQNAITQTLSAGPSENENTSDSLDLETQINVEMALFDSGGKRADNLQRAFNALMTIPPTSVEAERVFSSTGYLCNHLRTSLKADSIDALSFLRSHYQGINKN
jgi:hypothetical protein